MTNQELEARLRALATAEAPPVPPAGAVEAIVARRVRGERIAVPAAVPSRRGMTWWVVGAAAAGLALLWPAGRDMQPTGERSAPAAGREDTALRTDAYGGFLLPAPLAAQATAEPSYRRLGEPAGPRLHPGRWLYSVHGTDAARVTTDTLLAFAIERAVRDGADAWLFLTGRRPPQGAIVFNDSTWLSHDALRPVARIRQLAPHYRIEETWRADDVLTGETRGGFTTWTTTSLRAPNPMMGQGELLHWYQLIPRLLTEPLGPGWKGSLSLAAGTAADSGTAYFNLAVVRGEAIETPAGRFDCWKVGLGREDNGFFFWVDRQRGWVIAIAATRGGATDYAQVLVSGEDLP